MQSGISIMQSQEIDGLRWDACINASPNGLIYATKDYLDYMTDHWTGIVFNDYEAVMPVPWRKKYGIKYSYEIPFIQQLGLFQNEEAKPVAADFLSLIFHVCSYGDYSFNFFNKIVGTLPRQNFILSLKTDYENLAQNFSGDAKQNIKKSQSNSLSYVEGTIPEAIESYRQLYGERISHVSQFQFRQFESLCELLQTQGKLLLRKVVGAENQTLAVALFLKDKRRIYNIMNSTFPEGRKREANYFLLSGVWKEFEKTNLIFDFEGSDIPGVKNFYEKFGAVSQPYSSLHFNKLPWPIRLLKK